MRNIITKILILFLVITGILALDLRRHNSGVASNTDKAHLLMRADHDPSSTYSLYKGSLDSIRDGIVLSPPKTIATS
jgi:hypothetical protein